MSIPKINRSFDGLTTRQKAMLYIRHPQIMNRLLSIAKQEESAAIKRQKEKDGTT